MTDDPMAETPPIERVEAVHPEVARALRAMSGTTRLRLAHEAWEMARDRLAASLEARRPEWCREEIRRQVARRLLGDSGGAASTSR